MNIDIALAIIICMLSANLVATAVLIQSVKKLYDRNVRTLAGIQTRLTTERKRNLKRR